MVPGVDVHDSMVARGTARLQSLILLWGTIATCQSRGPFVRLKNQRANCLCCGTDLCRT